MVVYWNLNEQADILKAIKSYARLNPMTPHNKKHRMTPNDAADIVQDAKYRWLNSIIKEAGCEADGHLVTKGIGVPDDAPDQVQYKVIGYGCEEWTDSLQEAAVVAEALEWAHSNQMERVRIRARRERRGTWIEPSARP